MDLNVEVDFILGYAGSFTEDLGYDVGATYYKYLGDDNGDVDFDYLELYTGLSYKIVSGTVWYSSDFSNSGETAWYAELNAEVPVVWDVGLVLHVGYNFGDYWKPDDVRPRRVLRLFGRPRPLLRPLRLRGQVHRRQRPEGTGLLPVRCRVPGRRLFSSESKVYLRHLHHVPVD